MITGKMGIEKKINYLFIERCNEGSVSGFIKTGKIVEVPKSSGKAFFPPIGEPLVSRHLVGT
ncbi:hypothetical protein A3H78_01160 [Candidatus Roizmanbacteria bacterium RIFCSPLOWO2_02_FULL_36_11]|uniref:Uncharacterized protein n=1 Tax=Candidatus Roizmanbacteria bacterium RIFCSPLOWO2_02_FULL_36_11 TaxID=1802071 RepID=A0A1F7JIL1_9BACT|nr:MAG: hypothetical protein A3H78_01160 [Candidatus Roizmanbacteria bacterium RIFCSPLOWO2_02_FULL_36_11]